MIKANELMIGNLVLDNKVNRKITGIKLDEHGDCVRLDDVATNRLIKNINPIPLTPEIFEKCGFEKDEVDAKGVEIWNKYSKGKLEIHAQLDHFVMIIQDKGTVKIYYLHQLQNLYFALTGEELKIEL